MSSKAYRGFLPRPKQLSPPAAPPDIATSERCAPLLEAIELNDADYVQQLLAAGVHDTPYQLALQAAAKKAAPALVRLLLDAPQQSEPAADQAAAASAVLSADMQGRGFALQDAVNAGCVGSVQLLLQAGAPMVVERPHAPGTDPWYTSRRHALHVACRSPLQSISILQALLDAGADINAVDSHGGSSLSHAAIYEHFDTMQFLLQSGADPNSKSRLRNRFNSPLHAAVCTGAQSGDIRGVQLLLQAGADVSERESSGFTPLQHALVEPLTISAEVWDPNAIVQVLLAAGADVACHDAHGSTAIARAARNCLTDVVSCMLSHPSSSRLQVTDLAEAAADAALASRFDGKDADPIAVMVLLLAAAAARGVSAAHSALDWHFRLSRPDVLVPSMFHERLAVAGLQGWLEAESVDLGKERATMHTMISHVAQCAAAASAPPAATDADAAADAAAKSGSLVLGGCCPQLAELVLQ